jgi:hypothetical protein
LSHYHHTNHPSSEPHLQSRYSKYGKLGPSH